jgi:hypothetical protein
MLKRNPQIRETRITHATGEVRVDFDYEIEDPIAGTSAAKASYAVLKDGEGALVDAKWGDAELSAELAAQLELATGDVTVTPRAVELAPSDLEASR